MVVSPVLIVTIISAQSVVNTENIARALEGDDMKPSGKSTEIDRLLGVIFGIDKKEAITNNVCAMCKKKTKGFRDARSLKEYTISGLCMECQDRIFGFTTFDGDYDERGVEP